MVFEYKRETPHIDAYGMTFEIPAKTAFILDEVSKIAKELTEVKTVAETVTAYKKMIAIIIGKENVDKIYPDESKIDTDEIMAFWLAINQEMNNATNNALKKYIPNREVRRAVK